MLNIPLKTCFNVCLGRGQVGGKCMLNIENLDEYFHKISQFFKDFHLILNPMTPNE